jgi:hypothetical protein
MNGLSTPGVVWRSPWTLAAIAALLAWAILGIGFRILYDSVIPEVFLLILSGFAFGFCNSPHRAAIALAGLIVGITISERVFPVPAPAAHVARYGPPAPPSVAGRLLLSAFPTFGAVVGALLRQLARADAAAR